LSKHPECRMVSHPDEVTQLIKTAADTYASAAA
jgi:hypothetical protein